MFSFPALLLLFVSFLAKILGAVAFCQDLGVFCILNLAFCTYFGIVFLAILVWMSMLPSSFPNAHVTNYCDIVIKISLWPFFVISWPKYWCDLLLWHCDQNIGVTNCCDIVTKYWCYQTLGAVAFCQDWVKTSGEGFMPMIIWYSLTANILPSVSFYKNHRTNS